MKLSVFCLLVVVNFSDNGKASIDSVVPNGINLLKDTTRSSDKSCHRTCKFNVKPRRCEYKFKVEPSIDVDGKSYISINGLIPGPPINVCANDIVVVEVENKIPDQDLAIHWHGIEQKGTPYMDGVPMVTQCPIGYGAKYKYAFRADSPGTYFYHADSVSQQTDGVFGALIVNQLQPLEPHSALYDYDRVEENTLLISAEFNELLTGNLEDLNRIGIKELNINGERDSFSVFVNEGYAYRLRLINAIGINCPIVFSVDGHQMTVIASDAKPVKRKTAKAVQLYPGERMDVVVKANQPLAGYWMEARGVGEHCAGLHVGAMLVYNGYNYTDMIVNGKNDLNSDIDLSSVVIGQYLESLVDVTPSSTVRQVYLGIDRKMMYSSDETKNDYRYISDALPKMPFYPAPMVLEERSVVEINDKSFLYPNTPILFRPKEVHPEILCKVGEEAKHPQPQCLQMLTAKDNEVIELALVNEGFGSNDSYVFHMHGYNMQVIANWQNPEGKPISKQQFLQWDNEGKINRNLVNPPMKDNIVVPNKGYTIVRIRTDQPGSWLLECRACGFNALPTAVLISVPQRFPKALLQSMPKCGNYRPPDVLLN